MLQSLQFLRGMAAVLVVLFHTSGAIFIMPKYFNSQPFGRVFDFGYAGVDLFFVLSGFIIWKIHGKDVGQPAAWMAYIVKRLRRIYPPYWIALTLMVPVYFLVPSFGKGTERDIDQLLCSYLLLPHPTNMPILTVAWSLVFELFFYVMFSLLILNRWLGGLAFAVWIGVVALKPSGVYPMTFLSHDYHWEFLMGIVTSMIVERVRLPRPEWIALAGAVIFFGFGLREAFQSNLGEPWCPTVVARSGRPTTRVTTTRDRPIPLPSRAFVGSRFPQGLPLAGCGQANRNYSCTS